MREGVPYLPHLAQVAHPYPRLRHGRDRSPTTYRITRRRVVKCLFLLTGLLILVQLCRRAASYSPPHVLEQTAHNAALGAARDGFTSLPLHFLITATHSNFDLCKTLLATGILGYPSPTILAWEAPLHDSGLGGGSHMYKISRTLKYFNSLSDEQDDELVLAIDAYDIHFQLHVDILKERFHRINAEHNERLKKMYGVAAYEAGNIRQRIVFGAGKRCFPNARWEIACWAVPPSPASDKLYGNNTDTLMGHNDYWSNKQQWLNSGYIMGDVKSMRKMLTLAQKIADRHKHNPLYSGSDQSVFGLLYGYQSYAREVKRIQHLTRWERYMHPERQKPRSLWSQSVYIDNMLNPSVGHIPWKPDADVDYELGIGIDYFSDLGHQTMNSNIGIDSAWIMYTHPDNANHAQQVHRLALKHRHDMWDCPIRTGDMPNDDIMAQPPPFHALYAKSEKNDDFSRAWDEVPLYTHLCFGTIPVMLHHNGQKWERENKWTENWYQPYAKKLLQAAQSKKGLAHSFDDWADFKKHTGVKRPGGSWTDKGEWMNFSKMCPESDYGDELYKVKQVDDEEDQAFADYGQWV